MVLLIPTSWAAVFAVSTDGMSLQEAVTAASDVGGHNEIVVDPAYDGADDDPVDLGSLDLEIDGGGATLPPLAADGASLALSNATLRSAAPYEFADANIGKQSCALCLQDSEVELTDVHLSGIEGFGAIVSDSELVATRLSASGGWSGRGLWVSSTVGSTVRLTDGAFERHGAGALKFYGTAAKKLDVTLENVAITDNYGGEGAAIYAAFAELLMKGGSVTGNHAANSDQAATLHGVSSQLVFETVQLTDNYGDAAGLLRSHTESGLGVVFRGCTLSGNQSSSEIELLAETLTLDSIDWTVGGVASVDEGLLLTSSRVSLAADVAPRLASTDGGALEISRTQICGSGGSRVLRQMLGVGVGGRLSMTESAVTDTGGLGAPLIALGDLAGGEAASVSLVDNTFRAVYRSAFFQGATGDLQFINNLVDAGTATNGLTTAPSGSYESSYNLWNGTVGTFYDGLPGGGLGDVSADPSFDDAVTTDALCGEWPELRSDSPAIDAGHPELRALDERSDIGARDFGGNVEDPGFDTGDPGDTGDSGDSGDTGDSGATPEDGDGDGFAADVDCDDADGAVHPGAEDLVGDDVDQDCDGAAAQVAYAGGCGCSAGGEAGPPAALALVALLAGAARARRRGR